MKKNNLLCSQFFEKYDLSERNNYKLFLHTRIFLEHFFYLI